MKSREALSDALRRRIRAGGEAHELAGWHVQASTAARKQRDTEAALEHLNTATRLVPNRDDAWFMMAQVQEDAGQLDQVIRRFPKLLNIFQKDEEPAQRFHSELARLNRNVGDPESEALHLSHIVDFGEYTDSDCMRLIELLAKLGRHAELGNRLEGWALRGQLLDAESLHASGENLKALAKPTAPLRSMNNWFANGATAPIQRPWPSKLWPTRLAI